MTQEQQAQGTTSAQAQTQPTDVTQTATQPTDEVQAKIDNAIKAAQEAWKKEIAGLNRRNSELEKSLQEKELEKLNEKERAQKELELAKAEKDKILSETVKLKRQTAVVGKGLDPEFANLISGNTDEEITQSVSTIQTYIEKEVAKRMELERNKAFGGQSPIAGLPPQAATLQSAYDEAKKANNVAQMTAIQRHAGKIGESLKI